MQKLDLILKLMTKTVSFMLMIIYCHLGSDGLETDDNTKCASSSTRSSGRVPEKNNMILPSWFRFYKIINKQ